MKLGWGESLLLIPLRKDASSVKWLQACKYRRLIKSLSPNISLQVLTEGPGDNPGRNNLMCFMLPTHTHTPKKGKINKNQYPMSLPLYSPSLAFLTNQTSSFTLSTVYCQRTVRHYSFFVVNCFVLILIPV